MWEFSSCHDQNVWNVPAISEYSWQFSEDFWTLLKMSEDVLITFELFLSYLKDDIFSALLYFLCTKSILSIFFGTLSGKLNWIVLINHILKNNSLKLVSLAWEIVHDAWDRCLQSTDSHIMGKNTLYTSHNQYQCMLNRSHCTIGHTAIAFIFITSMMSPGQYSLCPFRPKVTTVTPVFIDF